MQHTVFLQTIIWKIRINKESFQMYICILLWQTLLSIIGLQISILQNVARTILPLKKNKLKTNGWTSLSNVSEICISIFLYKQSLKHIFFMFYSSSVFKDTNKYQNTKIKKKYIKHGQ